MGRWERAGVGSVLCSVRPDLKAMLFPPAPVRQRAATGLALASACVDLSWSAAAANTPLRGDRLLTLLQQASRPEGGGSKRAKTASSNMPVLGRCSVSFMPSKTGSSNKFDSTV